MHVESCSITLVSRTNILFFFLSLNYTLEKKVEWVITKGITLPNRGQVLRFKSNKIKKSGQKAKDRFKYYIEK